LTPAGALFTVAPTIAIGGMASSATAILEPTGPVTAVNVINRGKGYSTTPTISIADAGGGTGADAKAILSTATGIGAQAVVQTSSSQSFDVLAKAEQELFDASGRYNSTGGVEIPWTNGLVQTTIPLNYIDSATELLKDGEIQIWKLVDNGFWSNSIHFDMADVQLINRVGWDGTIKPPASNEVGWKDTVRLNPLEDVIVAMRANRTKIPFGLPVSRRALDPSKPAGAAGSGLGFTVAAGTTPALAANNVGNSNFNNEFAWGSAILGHAENDFTRAVVFAPTVLLPDAPTDLTDAQGNGKMTWTDPTPANAVTTPANSRNEVGFKVFKGATETARVPANMTSWTDPTPSAAVYTVVGFNAAGDSVASNQFVLEVPVVPANFRLGTLAFNSVTLAWDTPKLTTYQLEVWRTVGGGALTKIATIPGNSLGFIDNAASATRFNYAPAVVSALMSYTYQIKAVNVLGAVPSAVINATTPMEPVAAPTNLKATQNAARTSVALSWTDNATNETEYWVETYANGSAFSAPTKIARTAVQKIAINGAVTANVTTTPSGAYTFRVTAVNVTGAAVSTSSPPAPPVTVNVLAPAAPAAPATPTNFVATVAANTGAVSLSWAAVAPAAGTTITYVVGINGVKYPAQTGRTFNPTTAQMPPGAVYNVTVEAVATQFGVSTNSVPVSTMVDRTIPTAPTGVGAVAGAANSQRITVSWTDASINETGFTVQRATVTGGVAGTYGNAGTVGAGIQTFLDTNINKGRVYQYQVRANGAAGNSAYVGAASTVVGP
jgi:hypothetical protein